MSIAMRNAVLALLAMILACGFSYALTPSKKLSDVVQSIQLETSLPKQFGDWRMDDNIMQVSTTPVQQQTLDETYDQVISRTYVNGQGRRIMLSMAYGSAQTKQLRAHRQEVCYAAQGFQITNLRHDVMPLVTQSVKITRMVATLGRRVEPVTYWFTMGNEVVLSLFDRQIVQLKYALSGVIPDGYLVRVSSIGDDEASENALQQQFSEALMAAVSPDLRRRLIGSL
ncbi:MAG TPA: EpsI family protein [Rhodocyclaceae bacterium]|nr:EpsI family protein [Rhodocyclaceae bacterium]